MVVAAYRHVEALGLSIDSLQPEKGQETLYVVRELNATRLWCAEALLSSNADEVRRLLSQARAWATPLGRPVHLWLSDKQDAFVTGIAAEFPGVPPRSCGNHLLRDVATPMLEAERHAKVKMRRQVRGWRPIEREVLQQRRPSAAAAPAVAPVTVPPVSPPPANPLAKDVPVAPEPHRRIPARSCWMTGVPCVVGSMTIRGGRSNRPAYAWRRPWETSVRRSNATSMPTVAVARTPNSSAWPPVSTAAWPRCRQHTTASVSNGKSSSVSPRR